MSSAPQQTLKRKVEFTGIGLHSGKKIHCALHPAPPNSGIVFRVRQDSGLPVQIKAHVRNTGALSYNTTLQRGDVRILTVEHLLSALHGYQIDNTIIDLTQGEIPVMDGSAAPFVFLLSEAGIAVQNAPKHTVRVRKAVRVEHDDAWIEALPTDGNRLEIDYTIDFNHPVIGKMSYHFDGDPRKYTQNIAPARTFGFLKEVEYLRRNGLIKGASMNNAVVLDDRRVISGELRFRNEFVRHKIMDFWGDIMLLGKPLIARIRAFKAGHRLHALLVQSLISNAEIMEPAWDSSPQPAYGFTPSIATSVIAKQS